MTQQQATNLHLPNGGKIQATMEFILPDQTVKPIDPADQVSWTTGHVCVYSPVGRDYPAGKVRLIIKDNNTTLLDREVKFDFSTEDMDAYVLPGGTPFFTHTNPP